MTVTQETTPTISSTCTPRLTDSAMGNVEPDDDLSPATTFRLGSVLSVFSSPVVAAVSPVYTVVVMSLSGETAVVAIATVVSTVNRIFHIT